MKELGVHTYKFLVAGRLFVVAVILFALISSTTSSNSVKTNPLASADLAILNDPLSLFGAESRAKNSADDIEVPIAGEVEEEVEEKEEVTVETTGATATGTSTYPTSTATAKARGTQTTTQASTSNSSSSKSSIDYSIIHTDDNGEYIDNSNTYPIIIHNDSNGSSNQNNENNQSNQDQSQESQNQGQETQSNTQNSDSTNSENTEE